MWSSLPALTVVGMLNPVRLGVTLLVSSRPRPLPNLLAYWAGSLTMGIPTLAIPLIVLHYTPAFGPYTRDWAASERAPASGTCNSAWVWPRC
jgi:Sap, sulfolipid-1-addressing protein